jgi:CDGSH-type Zn-finger protein
MEGEHKPNSQAKIVIEKGGPYLVYGNVPLVRKTQVVSEYGEPLTWQKGETIEAGESYMLCRCGHSRNKPFCDMSHVDIDFQGTETADTRPTAERRQAYAGSTKLIVRHDDQLCAGSGFCGTRLAHIAQLVTTTDEDTTMRSQVIAMVERCPSGSLTYSMGQDEPDIEPDLPQQIAVTTEITSSGPIEGPLWVTGYIPVERSDGQPFEARNRVALCSCGLSKNKPLCDGSHRQGR